MGKKPKTSGRAVRQNQKSWCIRYKAIAMNVSNQPGIANLFGFANVVYP